MEYPVFVFRSPGSYSGPRGSCYNLRQVVDADDHADALAHGWFDTAEAAVAAAGADAYTHGLQSAKLAAVLREQPWLDDLESEPEPEPEDDAPPTREEMLAKAQQLGLRVDKRWSDETLLAKISVALAAAPAPAPVDDDPI